ncbi:hypothetical protein [Thermodesulfatator atlanticus]|uniref:hypothetical protein n=1 Tax=Thermodesulfatator atlanticus TaxID=501497 RepID=UPI0003B547C6|nr:hypothetical protein [Thermodesulfatator atlanticus]
MAEIISIKDKKRIKRGRSKRLKALKEELLRVHGIDLDRLMASEPAIGLTMEEFHELTEQLLEIIDTFCETHPHVAVEDILYVLENLKEIIRDTAE